MDQKEILNLCLKEGVLLDSEILNLFSEESEDLEAVKLVLEKIKQHTSARVITKSVLKEHKEETNRVFTTLPEDKQKKLEKLKIKLGLQIEISKEVMSKEADRRKNETDETFVKVLSKPPLTKEKIEVGHFIKTMRDRFLRLKNILQERHGLDDLISINRLSNQRKKVSILGMVSDKRTTKNKNLLLEVEDLTGRVRILINNNKPELFEQGEELPLDAVVGFSGFGDREILFANKVVLPEARLHERKKSPADEAVLFIGDLHFGSKLFMKENFMKFIDYLNGKTNAPKEEVENIKYLFIVGDAISGVGVYPGQDKDLETIDIEEQYQKLAEILGKIRKDIKIIISPGNHDGVRLMEPQPMLDEKYAWPLYNMENVILTANPSYVNIGAKKEKNFEGFNVLTYHGFSYPYYGNNIPSLVSSGFNAPEKIMTYLLKHRHLAPSFGSNQTLPLGKDNMIIDKIPDVLVSGHSHKCAITHHNNILIVSGSSWEEESEYQKRKGNQPDFCKVPMLNLKTREVKLLDFE